MVPAKRKVRTRSGRRSRGRWPLVGSALRNVMYNPGNLFDSEHENRRAKWLARAHPGIFNDGRTPQKQRREHEAEDRITEAIEASIDALFEREKARPKELPIQ